MKATLFCIVLLFTTSGEYRTTNSIQPYAKYTLWEQVGPGTVFDFEVIDAYASYKRVIFAADSKAQAEAFMLRANQEYQERQGDFPKFFATSEGKADNRLVQLKERPDRVLKLQKTGNVIMVPPLHRLIWQQRKSTEKIFAIGMVHYKDLGQTSYYNNSPVKPAGAFQR